MDGTHSRTERTSGEDGAGEVGVVVCTREAREARGTVEVTDDSNIPPSPPEDPAHTHTHTRAL